ncbi:putative Ig domain-containing protein [uncultured Granulicatella sp.]|uniref:putative Ig domain-containing protein n=1 Tax=uncultured Granulicatella sp. TaxID=316089 RepID=UPI0028D08158|nr:putative Ig domain-containing protein [uncultured Granulicatella sp.]
MKFEKRQKFSIRKFSVGVASVIIGQFFLGGTINMPVVQANEVAESSIISQDKGVEELQPSKGDIPADVTKEKKEKVELGNEKTVPSTNEIKKEEKVVISETDKTDVPSKLESEVSNNRIDDHTDNKTKESTIKEEGLESNLSKEQLNNAIVEGEVVTKEAEKFLNNLNDSTNKAEIEGSLRHTSELLKEAKSTFLSKEVNQETIDSHRLNLSNAIETLWNQMKSSGHTDNVTYMLNTAGVQAASSANEKPYMTIERYFGANEDRSVVDYKLIKDGSTIEIKYKVGLTRITPDEVELTQDAKDLGFTYEKETGYLVKELSLNHQLANKKYVIGLQSKSDPATRVVANLLIEEPPVFQIVDDYSELYGNKDTGGRITGNGQLSDSVTYDKKTSTAYMTVTPFGYYIFSNKSSTISDVKSDTPQYSSNLWLSLPGRSRDYNLQNDEAPVKITRFEVKNASPGVEVEFIKDGPAKGDNIFITNDDRTTSNALTDNKRVTSGYSAEYDYVNDPRGYSVSPYRINFKSLPEQAGNYFIDFQVTDNIGRVTNYHLNLITKEVSQTSPSLNDGTYVLTNADVMFEADKIYRVSNPTPVAIPSTNQKQIIGNLVLNKANATLEIQQDSIPQGITIEKNPLDKTKYVVTKNAGVLLPPGVYSFKAKAIDGHFGKNDVSRTFKFEVLEGLNNIPDQTWQEGQAIPNIPISLTNGTNITSLSVEYEGEDGFVRLDSNSNNNGLAGFALKKTEGKKTAILTATYLNNENESRQIKTRFTYEVTPRPVSDLSLTITNDKQTIVEGNRFKDIQLNASEGAELNVEESKLPDGVTYDKVLKKIAGIGQYEGQYVIPVTASKNGESITKLVELTVTPGAFNIPSVSYEYTAGKEIAPITLKIPASTRVTYTSGSLPNGLKWSEDKKTITGTPTQVGTYTVSAEVTRTTSKGTSQRATATVKIKVNSVPLNFTIPDNRKEVKVLDALPSIQLQAEGAHITLTSGSLPPGVNYNSVSKTLEGTPTRVGTYTATFTATSATISGNTTASASVTITVTPRDLNVTVENKNQEKTVLSPVDEVRLTVSDEKARLELDTSKLPQGLTYNASTKTISGTATKVGDYSVPYKATFAEMADSPVSGGYIRFNIRPLPVSINVTDKEQTIHLGENIKNMVVSHSEHSKLGARYLSVDLPETDLDSYLESTAGLHYDRVTHTISGTPTKAGVYKIRLKASVESDSLGKGTAEEIITLKVIDDPVSLDMKNDRQLIVLGNKARPVTLQVPSDARVSVDQTKLPSGLTYNEQTKTIEGTPTVAGQYDIPVTVTSSSGNKTITKDISIDVVDLTPQQVTPPTISVKENNDGTHTITITQPDGQSPIETIIKNGKDGETPKVKVERDETKKETKLTFYKDVNANNEFDENTDTVLGTSVIKDGADGQKGEQGQAGPQGVAGPKGDKGDPGAVGPQGATGAKGEQGQAGRDGKDGETPKVKVERDDAKKETKLTFYKDVNANDEFDENTDTVLGTSVIKDGADGQKGEQGQAGPQGVAGPKGDKGDPGAVGPQGATGAKGEQGQAGRDGKDGETPKVKVERDDAKKETKLTFYKDVNANNEFDENTDTVLGTLIVKDGQDGATGPKGDTGEAGPQGVAGPKGDKGDPGETGPQGVAGPKGDKGDPGAAGAKGEQGEQGQAGRDGKDGETPKVKIERDEAKKETKLTFYLDKNGDSQFDESTDEVLGTFVVKDGETGPKGDKGETGVAGQNGTDGKDGTSPVITLTDNNDGSYTISVTNPDGTKQEVVVKNGKDGKDGTCNCSITPTNGTPTNPTSTNGVPSNGTTTSVTPSNGSSTNGTPTNSTPSTNTPGNNTPVGSTTIGGAIPSAIPVNSDKNPPLVASISSTTNKVANESNSNNTLPNTGAQTEVLPMLLGSGILLTLYVGKRKEE